jgi:hypothetical protein
MSHLTTAWVLGIVGVLAGRATATPNITIGTNSPLSGAQLPGHGKWFVLCEARKDTNGDGKVDATFDGRFAQGDAYEPYLILGSGGPGIEIEHVAAKSSDGTWIAVVRAGKLELHDTTKATAVTLAADLTYDSGWGRRHEPRFASIGPGGKYMTYLTADAIVIRELATGTERSVKVQGKLWRADIEDGERWAQVKVVRKDSNRDGKLGWDESLGKWMYGCTSDTLHARMGMGDKSDAATTLWLDLTTKTVVEDPTVIGAVGDELLRRKPDGTLLLGTSVIAPPACRARVAAVLAMPPRAAINCGTKKDSDGYKDKPVVIVGPNGFRKDTTFEMDYRDTDGFTWDVYAGLRFRNDFKTALDLATGDVITVPGAIAGHRDHLVTMRTATGIAVFDLLKRTTTALVGSAVVSADRIVDIDDNLVTFEDKTWDAISGVQLVRPGMIIHRRMDDGRYLVSPAGRRGPLQLAR